MEVDLEHRGAAPRDRNDGLIGDKGAIIEFELSTLLAENIQQHGQVTYSLQIPAALGHRHQ